MDKRTEVLEGKYFEGTNSISSEEPVAQLLFPLQRNDATYLFQEIFEPLFWLYRETVCRPGVSG